MTDANRKATQEFSVRNALVTYCGQRLTPELIDRIVAELTQEMQSGPTAWAFGVAPCVATPGHSWHDYGQQNGRNRSWCSRCKLVVWTGEEPDSPCVSMPTVGVAIPLKGDDRG